MNNDNEAMDDDIELDSTDADLENNNDEPELIDIEEKSDDKLKKMREKIARLEEEKKQILDDVQRDKADFLNARKRLEEERIRDRVRSKQQHVEELLPLCDSFQMATSDKEAWEKADEAWRKGVEGIHIQLLNLLNSYGVKEVDPTGDTFDPHKHEAIGTEEVADEKQVDTIVSVVQMGYEMKIGDNTETIRPARVTTGTMKN